MLLSADAALQIVVIFTHAELSVARVQAAARPEPAAVAELLSEGEAQEAVDQAAARRLPDMPSTPTTPAADGKDDDPVGSPLQSTTLTISKSGISWDLQR